MSKQSTLPNCGFAGRTGNSCPESAEKGSDFCFWHDEKQPKTGKDIKARLESLAREGRSLEGFVLKSAHLADVNLTLGNAERSVDLSGADLSRANLTGAHMYSIDLRGANLMKAGLSQANLNRARLEDTNLLGAELEGTRMEQVDWGRHLYQEMLAREAQRQGRAEEAMDLYQEAEEIYRNLTSEMERRGHFQQAGKFYHRGKIMGRMQMRRWSQDWIWSKLVDLLCGYGEQVSRVILFALLVILGCGMLYFFLGVKGPDGLAGYRPGAGVRQNLGDFLLSLYYSVVTFTTLGYGDFVPAGWSRGVAAIEAFIGAFSISLFVVVFVRKMSK